MSIKIKVSYTDEGEKRLILKLLRPLLERDTAARSRKAHPEAVSIYSVKGI